jgi:hypothetical protein
MSLKSSQQNFPQIDSAIVHAWRSYHRLALILWSIDSLRKVGASLVGLFRKSEDEYIRELGEQDASPNRFR